ncbi:hypothetical protein [Streptomyces olivaceus]|uniref:hypothetical protein n=1 Tax=Streptomyces olivaceus TaxID=47716 RepID=UPI004057A694
MFDREVNYPIAVASYDDEGVRAAISWCLEQRTEAEALTVWTPLKANLEYCPSLSRLVARYSDVEHITGRGTPVLRRRGPVLMAWPDMKDIGKLTQFTNGRLAALCVLSSDDEGIGPWVKAARPVLLSGTSVWEEVALPLDPVVVEALKGLTLTVNHNNTISAGYEKDMVVSVLLALHDAGLALDGDVTQGWALAHGWVGDNPGQLAKYIEAINQGKRPRCRRILSADYVDSLRRRVADAAADDSRPA